MTAFETKRRSGVKALSWRLLATIITTVVTFVLTGKLTWDVSASRDLQLGDEVAYMHDAARIPVAGMPPAEAAGRATAQAQAPAPQMPFPGDLPGRDAEPELEASA